MNQPLTAMQHAGLILEHCESSENMNDQALVEYVLAGVAAWRSDNALQHMRMTKAAINGVHVLSWEQLESTMN